jgi:Cu/Ag efflux protein CusF
MIKACCLVLLALALVGCGSKKEEGKRYPVQADVISVDQTAKSATLATGKVGDWMDAMTMEYPVKPDGDLAKLHTGDHIEATVVVQGPKYYVTGVKVVSKK